MKRIKRISEYDGIPFTFKIESYSESEAYDLLQRVISKAREVISNIVHAYKSDWIKNPSTNIRAVFGHWFVKAMRHFATITFLCEERDLSVVANLHHRQIFELYLQTRFYAHLSDVEKEVYARKIEIFGCLEYLEKLDSIKENEHIKGAYQEVTDLLTSFDDETISKYKEERDRRSYFWFGRSFSRLANDINREGEDLRGLYQIISSDIHGVWDLILDVKNPEPGVLDFRGYPDKTTMYIRAVETLDQVTSLMMDLWNEIAKSVRAEQVIYD